MVSLSLSIAISKMVCPTHLYVYQHEMQQKTGFTYVRVLGRAFVSLMANEDKLHTVRKYMCVCETSPFAELWMIV